MAAAARALSTWCLKVLYMCGVTGLPNGSRTPPETSRLIRSPLPRLSRLSRRKRSPLPGLSRPSRRKRSPLPRLSDRPIAPLSRLSRRDRTPLPAVSSWPLPPRPFALPMSGNDNRSLLSTASASASTRSFSSQLRPPLSKTSLAFHGMSNACRLMMDASVDAAELSPSLSL